MTSNPIVFDSSSSNLSDSQGLPFEQTFEGVWEKEAKWISGPQILGDIVDQLRGKSLVARYEDGGHALQIRLPLPVVKDESGEEEYQAIYAVPEKIRSAFSIIAEMCIHHQVRASKLLLF